MIPGARESSSGLIRKTFFTSGLILDIGGQRLHLHIGVGIEAEVPEAALAVGQIRIDRGIVQEQDGLAGLRSLCLSIASISANAARSPVPATRSGYPGRSPASAQSASPGGSLVVERYQFKFDT